MALTVLCADRKCVQRGSCLRFTIDPASELAANKRVRIEQSLRGKLDQDCKKYRSDNLTNPGISS